MVIFWLVGLWSVGICPVSCFLYVLLLLCILCFCAYEAIPPQKVTNGNPQGILAIMLKLLFFPLISGAADKKRKKEKMRENPVPQALFSPLHISQMEYSTCTKFPFSTLSCCINCCVMKMLATLQLVVGGVSDPCIKKYCCSCYIAIYLHVCITWFVYV